MADLRVAALTKAFDGTPILRGVELVVSSGSLVAILGASGSGKTTLLRLLSGFERADSGTIEIGGSGYPVRACTFLRNGGELVTSPRRARCFPI